MEGDRKEQITWVVLGRLAQRKWEARRPKALYLILHKFIFNPVGLVWSFEVLAKIRRFHRGGGGENFMIVDGSL